MTPQRPPATATRRARWLRSGVPLADTHKVRRANSKRFSPPSPYPTTAMPTSMITRLLRTRRDKRFFKQALLPWHDLEAEARRQGCSAADIFFDRAGRCTGLLAPLVAAPATAGPAVLPARRHVEPWLRRVNS